MTLLFNVQARAIAKEKESYKMNAGSELLKNLDKLHTTELGVERIKRNLSLDIDTNDVVKWCRTKINSVNAIITRNGKARPHREFCCIRSMRTAQTETTKVVSYILYIPVFSISNTSFLCLTNA